MSTVTIAIDPGKQGGIAWSVNATTYAIPMPDTTADLRETFWLITEGADTIHCVLEKTGGYVPGNSGPAAVTFARHCGQIEGVLTGMMIPFEQVAPTKWQKVCGALPRKKSDRKRAIKEFAQQLYPDIPVTLKTADALAILTWYSREHGRARA